MKVTSKPDGCLACDGRGVLQPNNRDCPRCSGTKVDPLWARAGQANQEERLSAVETRAKVVLDGLHKLIQEVNELRGQIESPRQLTIQEIEERAVETLKSMAKDFLACAGAVEQGGKVRSSVFAHHASRLSEVAANLERKPKIPQVMIDLARESLTVGPLPEVAFELAAAVIEMGGEE